MLLIGGNYTTQPLGYQGETYRILQLLRGEREPRPHTSTHHAPELRGARGRHRCYTRQDGRTKFSNREKQTAIISAPTLCVHVEIAGEPNGVCHHRGIHGLWVHSVGSDDRYRPPYRIPRSISHQTPLGRFSKLGCATTKRVPIANGTSSASCLGEMSLTATRFGYGTISTVEILTMENRPRGGGGDIHRHTR